MSTMTARIARVRLALRTAKKEVPKTGTRVRMGSPGSSGSGGRRLSKSGATTSSWSWSRSAL